MRLKIPRRPAAHTSIGGCGPETRGRIPRWTLPAWLVGPLSLFERSLKSLRADLGVTPVARSGYVTDLTGVAFRPGSAAVRAAGESLVEHGVV